MAEAARSHARTTSPRPPECLCVGVPLVVQLNVQVFPSIRVLVLFLLSKHRVCEDNTNTQLKTQIQNSKGRSTSLDSTTRKGNTTNNRWNVQQYDVIGGRKLQPPLLTDGSLSSREGHGWKERALVVIERPCTLGAMLQLVAKSESLETDWKLKKGYQSQRKPLLR